MSIEWQCPYCKSWRAASERSCTHAHLPQEYDHATKTKRTILGAEPEIWTAEREPHHSTRLTAAKG